ncbi:hypothetical protein Sjap_018231 [Stephania japonica]|uniref:Uncharacterized protein n=1 Tax=Stephania japonica TaxID=461633 RepID=A0AAP0NMX9_9MAGN
MLAPTNMALHNHVFSTPPKAAPHRSNPPPYLPQLFFVIPKISSLHPPFRYPHSFDFLLVSFLSIERALHPFE